MKHTNIASIAIEHFQRELEVFSLITIRYKEGLGSAVVATVEVQLLHVKVRVANSDKSTELGSLLAVSHAQQFLSLVPPAVSVQVDAGRRTEESLLVPVGLLSNFSVKYNYHHVPAVSQVLLHGLPGQPVLLVLVELRPESVDPHGRGAGGSLHGTRHALHMEPRLAWQVSWVAEPVGGCEVARHHPASPRPSVAPPVASELVPPGPLVIRLERLLPGGGEVHWEAPGRVLVARVVTVVVVGAVLAVAVGTHGAPETLVVSVLVLQHQHEVSQKVSLAAGWRPDAELAS